MTITNPIKLSVVIPCHNAQNYISQTIETVLKNIPENSEVIVVENGSNDNSYETATKIAADLNTERRRIIVTSSPTGLGNALRQGLSISKGEIVAFMADDLPFGIQELSLIQECREHPGTVYAISKYLPKSIYRTTRTRKILGSIFVIIRGILLPTSLHDTQGSFIGNGNTLRIYIKTTREHAFLVTTELHAILFRNKIKVVEIPSEQSEDEVRNSTIKFRGITAMGLGLFRISFRLRLMK